LLRQIGVETQNERGWLSMRQALQSVTDQLAILDLRRNRGLWGRGTLFLG
jgi:hypothetical protein